MILSSDNSTCISYLIFITTSSIIIIPSHSPMTCNESLSTMIGLMAIIMTK